MTMMPKLVPTRVFKRRLTSFAKVRAFVGAIKRNRRFLVDHGKLAQKTYLDLGCGPNTDPEFINVDYGWHPGIDICWDITKPLPLSDGRIKGIYTEHCLEHLPPDCIESVLQDCFRLLASQGTLRIVVPDGELYLRAYCATLSDGDRTRIPYSESDQIGEIYSPIMSVNRIFREHGHLYIYDFDCLRRLLEKTGFTDIRKCAFRDGRDPNLLRDSPSREVESLYLEARRP